MLGGWRVTVSERASERAHLHGVLSTAQLQQVDDGVLALGPDASVLVLGVVQQAFEQRLHQRPLQAGRGRIPPHPPQHALRHQPDVAGLILETLREGNGWTTH